MAAYLDSVTFDQFLTHWAKDRPDRLALREGDRVYTYGEAEELTAKIASALIAAGLRKGDRIAWIGKNSDLYFLLFFGAARAGIVMAPVGWRLSPAEWTFIVNDTQAKLLFAGPGFEGLADQLAGKLEQAPPIVEAIEAWAMIRGAERAPFEPSGPDEAVLQL
jgi:fatty-acyl-CoA synthase